MSELITRSFTSGELSPALRIRADTTKYATGLALCENFIVKPQGGVYSRPGTRYVGSYGSIGDVARLIPFIFSVDQAYVLVFEEDNVLSFIRDGAFIESSPGVHYEIATPWVAEDFPLLKYSQDADVMTITHPNYPPYELIRSADNAWSLQPIVFNTTLDAPTLETTSPISISNITDLVGDLYVIDTVGAHGLTTGDAITITGVVGSNTAYEDAFNDKSFTVTVTAPTQFSVRASTLIDGGTYVSGGTFIGNTIGTVGTASGLDPRTYHYVVTAVGALGESLPSQKVSANVAALTSTYGTLIRWNPVTGADYYRVYKDPSDNTGVYGWIGDSESLQFVDFNIAPLTSDAPPDNLVAEFTRSPIDVAAATRVSATIINVTTASVHGLQVGDTFNITGTLVSDLTKFSRVISVVDEFSIVATGEYGIFTPQTSGELNYINYPSVNGFYQQRRWLANLTSDSQNISASSIGQLDNFRATSPTQDDDALSFSIRGSQVNEIRHLVDVGGLVLLTEGGEWAMTEGDGQVVTPTSIGFRKVGYRGCSHVPPVVIGDTVFFVQARGSRIRSFKVSENYRSNDMSITAEHLFEGRTVVDMAYAQEPDSVVWCCMSDGSVIAVTYEPEHQVLGWHRHTFPNGFVESLTTIPEGDRDVVYMVIRRSVGGFFVRYVEQLQARDTTSLDAGWSLDAALHYSGAPTTTFSNLGHLTGLTVSAVADGIHYPNLTVSAGVVTLPMAASEVTIGLPYTCAIDTLWLDLNSVQSPRGSQVSISRLVVEFADTRGGWVASIKDDGSYGTFREIKPRNVAMGYGPIPLRTYQGEVTMEPGWNRSGAIRIEQREPFPMTILGVIPDYDTSL